MQGLTEKNIAAIAFGSNIGDSETILNEAIADLKQTPLIQVLTVSPWYYTKPIGPPQPDYINGCLLAYYPGPGESLMQRLLDIEHQHGRQRTIRWGPRTLDLDLIFLGSTILDTEFLTLPHPRMHERRFVLEPLADIYPEWKHPHFNHSVQELLNQIKSTDNNRI